MKISHRIEAIFANAVALQQSGNLRNTIYGFKNYVYILNQDHTLLLKFVTDFTWTIPMGFKANDYDSKDFEIEEGKIVFIKKDANFIREKSCSQVELKPVKVHKIFKRRTKSLELANPVTISKDLISHLDIGLSHLEFRCKDGKFTVKQRDVYSGSLITVKPNTEKNSLMTVKTKDFKTIGLRTNDFISLFTFVNSLTFYFGVDGMVFVESKDPRMKFTGIISKCIYDELGG